MSNVIQTLEKKRLITPPNWLSNNVMFLGITGSVAYGASSDTSDMDVYGFCIPPKEDVFPHLRGEILGFGRQKQRFEQYQQHHIIDPSANGGKGQEYDLTVFSIVKFFHLCMENNPNMVDVLFLPRRCVLHSTSVYEAVRENRHLFLHKGCWHKFKGYAYAQMNKMRNQSNRSNEKRQESIDKFGYDVKFAYHIVRLMLEVQQILETGDLNLERDREIYKSIRRGEWTVDQITDFFDRHEKALEKSYETSDLPFGPDEDAIKDLLVKCLETHYGPLDDSTYHRLDRTERIVAEIEEVLEKYR